MNEILNFILFKNFEYGFFQNFSIVILKSSIFLITGLFLFIFFVYFIISIFYNQDELLNAMIDKSFFYDYSIAGENSNYKLLKKIIYLSIEFLILFYLLKSFSFFLSFIF